MTFSLKKFMLFASIATLLIGVVCLRARSISECERLEDKIENIWADEVYRYANEYIDGDLKTAQEVRIKWGRAEQKPFSLLEHCKYEAVFTRVGEDKEMGAVSASVKHQSFYLGRPIISIDSWGLGDNKLFELIQEKLVQQPEQSDGASDGLK